MLEPLAVKAVVASITCDEANVVGEDDVVVVVLSVKVGVVDATSVAAVISVFGSVVCVVGLEVDVLG